VEGNHNRFWSLKGYTVNGQPKRFGNDQFVWIPNDAAVHSHASGK
jgi:hypothetical protein